MAAARAFYAGLLGLREIPRPPTLAPSGVWFRFDDGRHLHISAMRSGDEPTRNRSHFALQVDDLNEFKSKLRQNGVAFSDTPEIPGWNRIRVSDPFGNSVEILQIEPPAEKDRVR